MRFSWTSGKAARNRLKHGVDFADAVIALEDGNTLTIEDCDHEEQRFKSLAMGPELKVLLVVNAFRDVDCIQIFSARKVSRGELKQYFQGVDS